MKRKFFVGLTAAVLAILIAAPAFAADFRAGENVSLRQGEVVGENLYAAGGNLTIDSQVYGDIFAAGGTVLLSGKVRDDVVVAGGNLSFLGEAGGDLRAAGGNISLGGPVGGELVVASGQISASSRTVIEKSAMIAGGTVDFGGEIKGKAEIRGGRVFVNGKIGGDLKIFADELTIGKDAVIGGALDYESPAEAVIEQGAAIAGGAHFTKTERHAGFSDKKFSRGWAVGGWFVRLLMMLTLGLLLYFIFKKSTVDLAKKNFQEFGWQLLRGLVVMIVMPVAAIIAAITVVGLPVAGIFMMIYAIFWILSGAMAGIVLGGILKKILWKKKDFEADWKTVIAGVVVYCLVTTIPYLGWLAAAVFSLTAFGGWWNFLYEKTLKER